MYISKKHVNYFDNQYLFFEEYQRNHLIKIRTELKVYFENVDQEIFLSSWRREHGYIPDGFKWRTLLTIYGPVTFKRRIYKYWNNTKYNYVFLTDKKLQIEKYSRVTSHLKFKIYEHIATGKRQRDICDIFSYASLTRTTISNIMKSFNFLTLSKYSIKSITRIKILKYLYINMDETFIRLRKNNKIKKYRIRLVVFHTGYDYFSSTKKRKVLANKRVYFQLLPISKKINTLKFMKKLRRIAKKFYSNIENIKVIFGGDGASWIREVSNCWENSIYILDKFHAIRYLKQFFLQKNNHLMFQNYKKSKNLFEMGEYHSLIKQLNQIIVNPEKEQKLVKIVNYFSNNAIGISNQNLEWNIGVSIESDISHIIKWLLGYGSKAFNYQTFKNMLFLKIAEVNQLDVLTFLKKQYQLEKERIKNFYWKSCWIK